MRFAERITTDSNNVDEKLWADLRKHFDEGQIVELAMAAGLFNYFNRFNNALKMEPTKPGEGGPASADAGIATHGLK